MGNLYRFVEPVVLLLLEQDGPTHGYDLAAKLHEHALTDAEIDRGGLYRTLRSLEAMGHVTSTWDTSSSGPARHVYAITTLGSAHLSEWTVVLSNLVKLMAGFVEDAQNLPGRKGPGFTGSK